MDVLHKNQVAEILLRAPCVALAIVLSLVTVVGTSSAQQAQVYKESVLYSFTGGTDGASPFAGLILDAKDNLYGTTFFGGTVISQQCSIGCGTVFKVDPTGKEIVLDSFKGGAFGENPYAGVILDARGNLYGTTQYGDYAGGGIAFRVNSKGKETILHSFSGSPDGNQPVAGVILDAKGNLFGTTPYGGPSGSFGPGVVFKVNSKGKETVLYSFTGGADGANPYAGLIMDAKGNLYGTTYFGGASQAGVVFKVNSKGKETVLYSFTGRADGANPYAGLIFDPKGNLYGTTRYGGSFGAGAVFKVNSKGKETVLYSFTGGADGGSPWSGLVLDAQGNLYGTTAHGGGPGKGCPIQGCGTIFKVNSKGKETVLYSFTGNPDGSIPAAGLVFDAQGNLYGTTFQGGAFDAGVVFKVSKL